MTDDRQTDHATEKCVQEQAESLALEKRLRLKIWPTEDTLFRAL